MEKHPNSGKCSYSVSEVCDCSCGGKLHGRYAAQYVKKPRQIIRIDNLLRRADTILKRYPVR